MKEEETEENGLSVVKISTPSFPPFEKMIRYIYSGDETIVTTVQELDILFELFRLADMYIITGLKGLSLEI